jgi:pyruvate kinase
MARVRTRIVATLGPATDSAAAIAALVDAGVDVFRLNFSHGTHAEHAHRIRLVREAAGDRAIAILQDLAGPKLRLAHPLAGEPGDVVSLALPDTVCPGDPVLVADGIMQLEVVDPGHARVIVGGDVPAGKGVNLPGSRLHLPAFTEKDARDLRFGVEHRVDFVALSFIGSAADLEPAEASGIPVIAKVDRAQALDDLPAIVARASGVLVARGDLGVEIPIEQVPRVQKELIAIANRLGKPVITATQMLRSMVTSALPTRAEATDVANAVLDGTDAVMLSEETAIGEHPVEAVRVMRRLVATYDPLVRPRSAADAVGVDSSIAASACALADRLDAKAIVVATQSGFTARQVARLRPRMSIVALTPDVLVRRQLSLVWGIDACQVAGFEDAGTLLRDFRTPLATTDLVRPGDRVVITAGWPLGQPGLTNLLHVATV